MNLRRARWMSVFVALAAPVAVAAPLLAGKAEYAVHWNPADGGPVSLEAVRDLLKLEKVKTTSFQVRVFSVKRPVVLPGEVQIIARERTSEGGTESSYKLRADVPLQVLVPEVGLGCPFKSANWDHEIDVIWGPSTDTPASAPLPNPLPIRIKFSRTCSVDMPLLKALPGSYAAKEPDCISSVIRHKGATKGKEIKVEQWKFAGGATLLELSMKVEADSVAARDDFYVNVIAPLIAAKAHPSASTKTELSQCQ